MTGDSSPAYSPEIAFCSPLAHFFGSDPLFRVKLGPVRHVSRWPAPSTAELPWYRRPCGPSLKLFRCELTRGAVAGMPIHCQVNAQAGTPACRPWVVIPPPQAPGDHCPAPWPFAGRREWGGACSMPPPPLAPSSRSSSSCSRPPGPVDEWCADTPPKRCSCAPVSSRQPRRSAMHTAPLPKRRLLLRPNGDTGD